MLALRVFDIKEALLMNIFLREMKAHGKSLVIWCIGVLLMIVGGMGKYAGAVASGQSINDIVAQMPKAIQAIIGAGTFDLSKASGYYGMFFMYIAVMATIHASMLGSNIISKEERDKTSEFLFVKPVSRNKIITCKLLAAFVNILIFNIITAFFSIIIVGYYSKGETVTGDIIKLMVGMFILQLIFMVIGTGISAMSKNSKSAPSVATGILLFTFILSKAIDLNSNLEVLKYITPFKYYDAKNLMYGGEFEPVFLILSALIIVLLLSVTYVFYKKRDLNV
jgi:ABC-2 type transport system permease protein